MKSTKHKAGTVLFRKGDEADHLYILAEGHVEFIEIGVVIGPGQMFGEIAFFAPDKRRTLSARCSEECLVLSINQSTVRQLYYQNPAFGFEIVGLVANRLSADVARLQDQLTDRAALGLSRRASRRRLGALGLRRLRLRRLPSDDSSASASIESSSPLIESAESSASFERAMRSGAMSAPSRAPSGTASARSPVPIASLSLLVRTGVAPPSSPSSASVFRRVAPWMSLPLSEVSLGPRVSASRPRACLGARSPPRMLLWDMIAP